MFSSGACLALKSSLKQTTNLIIILVNRESHGSKNLLWYIQHAMLLEFLKGAEILQHRCSLAAEQFLVPLARRQKSFLYWSCDSSVSLQRLFFFFLYLESYKWKRCLSTWYFLLQSISTHWKLIHNIPLEQWSQTSGSRTCTSLWSFSTGPHRKER